MRRRMSTRSRFCSRGRLRCAESDHPPPTGGSRGLSHPTPAHQKERQGNQRGTRGREEEKDETSPDDEHGPAQRRLHGTHAHTLWSGHLHHATLVSLPPLHTPLSWHPTSLAAGLGRLVTLLCTLGVHGAGRAGQHQQE